MPTIEDNKDIFSFDFNEDKTLLHVAVHIQNHTLTAEQLTRLIQFLAAQRAQMLPAISDDPNTAKPSEQYFSDQYLTHQDRTGGSETARVYLRTPGVGWTLAVFHPDDCQSLSENFARQIAPGSGTAH